MKDPINGTLIVKKDIKIEDENIQNDAKTEVKSLAKLKHPNVVQY